VTATARRRRRRARTRTGTVGLLARTGAPQRPITALLALLTLIVALCCGFAPRALGALAAADVRHAVDGLAAPARDVSGALEPLPVGPPPGRHPAPGGASAAFGRVDAALLAATEQASAPLRAVLGAPHVVARTTPESASPVTPIDAKGRYSVALAADPHYRRHIRLSNGALPRPWTADANATSPTSTAPIDMVVSTETARRMGLRVGDVLASTVREVPVRVRISGIFTPRAAGSDYWRNTPSIIAPEFEANPADVPRYTATGFVDPATLSAFRGLDAFHGSFWFPIAAGAVTSANARQVAAGIDALEARQIVIPADATSRAMSVPVSSQLRATIGESLGRIAATLAVIAVLLSGPGGVVVAVFTLGVRAVLERRGAMLALVRARGASPAQLRAAAALEGLAAGLPAGVLGAVVAAVVIPGADAAAWLLPLLAGLVPAAVFAVLGGDGRGPRASRRDLPARPTGGRRTIAEGCVVAAAAVAAFLLLRRGATAGGGIDPLLALAPLLVSLAVGVVVLRLVPLALRGALALTRAARGPVGFIGAARAMREPTLGLATALAVIVGVSIAALSSGVLATIDGAARTQAVAQTGADLRADGAVFDARTVAAVRRVPGVAGAASTMQGRNRDLGLNGRTSTVQPLFADTRALRAVHPGVPAGLGAERDGRVPLVVSRELLDGHPLGATERLGDVPVVVVGALPARSRLGADSRWVLVDSAFAGRLAGADAAPGELLVALRPGTRPGPVSAAIRRLTPGATVTAAQAALAAVTAAPAASGLRIALRTAAVGSALLAAIAVFAGSVAAAASRNSTIAMLRTMGMTGPQALGLVVWEIVPVVVVSAAVGLGLGLALPRLLVATTDFTPFTGSATRLAVTTDWAQLAGLTAAVLGVAALANLAAVLVARRTDPAGTVKMGAE
jgi:putative ABC transport system permease protein